MVGYDDLPLPAPNPPGDRFQDGYVEACRSILRVTRGIDPLNQKDLRYTIALLLNTTFGLNHIDIDADGNMTCG